MRDESHYCMYKSTSTQDVYCLKGILSADTIRELTMMNVQPALEELKTFMGEHWELNETGDDLVSKEELERLMIRDPQIMKFHTDFAEYTLIVFLSGAAQNQQTIFRVNGKEYACDDAEAGDGVLFHGSEVEHGVIDISENVQRFVTSWKLKGLDHIGTKASSPSEFTPPSGPDLKRVRPS